MSSLLPPPPPPPPLRRHKRRWWLLLSIALGPYMAVAAIDVLGAWPTATVGDFDSRVEVELFARDGNINFRYRAHGLGLLKEVEWRDFTVRSPKGVEVPCTGDDSERTFRPKARWNDFYTGCGAWDAPGIYRLLYRGSVVRSRALRSDG